MMNDHTTDRAVLVSSKDLALMEAERQRLRKERDAATNALHGMRRRMDRLTVQLREAREETESLREILEDSDEFEKVCLDHWDGVRLRELEQNNDHLG